MRPVRLLATPMGWVSLAGAGADLFNLMRKIIFPMHYETSVYMPDSNTIMVQQPGESHDDTIIINSKDQAMKIARAIIALAKECPFENEQE